MAKSDRGEALIGRAFKGPDGVVRWVTGISTRGYLQILWWSEESAAWHTGAICKLDRWPGGEEVDMVPKPGEMYRRMGALGAPYERTMEAVP